MNEMSVDVRGSRKGARTATLLSGAGALALVLGGVTLAVAPSASAHGIVKPGNPTCAQLIPGSTEIKFDPPNSGSKSGGGVTVTLTKRNLVADDPAHDGDQTGNEVVDFAAVGGKVLGVIVKGGPDGANFYEYPGGTSAGSGLHTPPNEKNKKFPDISHVKFCVSKPVTTPPTKPTTKPTKPTTPPTKPTKPPTKPTTAPTKPTKPPTKPTTKPPTSRPSVSPSDRPSDTPSTTAPRPESTPSTPVPVPTEVDAGLTGGGSAGTPDTGDRIAWGAGLLMLGGALLLGGVLKLRQRKGLHSA